MKILITTLLLISALFAEIKVGDGFPKLTLEDQFSKKTEVKQVGTTTLLLSFEKDVSAEIKKYLETKEEGFLEANNLMYISDISSMPSFITSMFAIPKMKKFSFKISLIYDEEEAEAISREEGKVTVIALENNLVKKIEFIEPKALDSLLNN
ncbi:MAG: FAD/FMN-containing dehydrogenases [uncultured Sulfurovum sp.]|uniref:FAD/FMN-containing dehydrogenases n=1 Tax=uncultured Sulfurovum sp. TaxID=269237 RepID=A0A6S6SUN8_9BACT|nr:MAG: FAD/FMN-containing dehydrogenases [uncultured Sulfurovum sp.]